MGFYAGKPIESAVYGLYKQLSAGNNLCYVISLYHNSVKWIKRWKDTYQYGGFEEFFLSVHFCHKEKRVRLIWVKILRNFYN